MKAARAFKGTVGQYTWLHQKMRKRILKPDLCPNCEIQPPRDLANISDLYLDDVSDWEWLCRRCHELIDGRMLVLTSRRFIDESHKQRFIAAVRTVEARRKSSESRKGSKWTEQHYVSKQRFEKRKKALGIFRPMRATLTPEKVIEIYKLIEKGHRNMDIADMYGVSRPVISNIKRHKAWVPVINRYLEGGRL